VAALAVGFVYAAFARITTRKHDIPLEPAPSIVQITDPTEARRLPVLLGCLSCHGKSGGGGKMELPGVVLLGAPNLTTVLPEYGDAELVRLIRFGVRRDGTTALGMPAATFYPLGDSDLAKVIAYLRNLPPAADRGPGRGVRQISFKARVGIVLGKFKTSAGSVDRTAPRWGELPRTTPFERGRYLASVTCAECHGQDFEGSELEGSPSLRIAAVYDLEQFGHLLRTGEPISKRDLGEMTSVAKEDFVLFNDAEIADLHAFFRGRFGTPAESASAPPEQR
jgi:mono/diheme cytochrome c family protein